MDQGLLAGLAEGLRSGLQTYRDETDKQYRRDLEQKKFLQDQAEAAERLGLLKEQREIQKAQIGYKRDDQGNLVIDPESIAYRKALKEEEEAKQKGLLVGEQIKKTRAETAKLQKESQGLLGTASKLSGEAKAKIGQMTSSLQSLDELQSLIEQGKKPAYITSETPYVGQFISDKPVDVVTRKLSDDIGRLRSGGAINQDEEKRFRNMLPRPGDSKEIALNKIQGIRDEFLTRSNVYGIQNPQESFGLLQKQQSIVPKVGIIEGGYKFKGGNPTDPKNWEKVK